MVKYIRKGKCKRCGKCCTMKHLFESMPEEDKELIKKVFPWLYTALVIGAAEDYKCPYLKYENGIAVCTIYPNRPEFCRRYPETPEDLIPGCGYYFEEVENDEE